MDDCLNFSADTNKVNKSNAYFTKYRFEDLLRCLMKTPMAYRANAENEAALESRRYS